MKDFIILSVLLPWLHPWLNIISNFQKYFPSNAFLPTSFDHIFCSSFCQRASHLRCFIQKSLFSSVFSDHLLWPAWALGCRHPHYSRSNFLTKYLQTICLQTVSAKMIAIEMIQIGGKWLQKLFKLKIKSVVKLFKLEGNGCRNY